MAKHGVSCEQSPTADTRTPRGGRGCAAADRTRLAAAPLGARPPYRELPRALRRLRIRRRRRLHPRVREGRGGEPPRGRARAAAVARVHGDRRLSARRPTSSSPTAPSPSSSPTAPSPSSGRPCLSKGKLDTLDAYVLLALP